MSKIGNDPDIPLPDPAEFAKNMVKVATQSQQLVTEFLRKQGENGGLGPADPLNVGSAFLEMTAKMMANPQKLVEAQLGLWEDYLTTRSSTRRRPTGGFETRPGRRIRSSTSSSSPIC